MVRPEGSSEAGEEPWAGRAQPKVRKAAKHAAAEGRATRRKRKAQDASMAVAAVAWSGGLCIPWLVSPRPHPLSGAAYRRVGRLAAKPGILSQQTCRALLARSPAARRCREPGAGSAGIPARRRSWRQICGQGRLCSGLDGFFGAEVSGSAAKPRLRKLTMRFLGGFAPWRETPGANVHRMPG